MAPILGPVRNAGQIHGVPIASTLPTSNQFLRYNGTTKKYEAVDLIEYQYIPINAKDFLTGPAEAGYWDTDELPNGFPQIRMKYTHTEAHACFAEVQMPEDWDGGDLTIADTWKTPSADLNTFALDVYAVRIADGDTDDVAITTKVATITDTNTGAGKNNQSAESSAFTITGTGKKIRFRFVRDYGTDTIEDFVNLLEVMIKCIVIKA